MSGPCRRAPDRAPLRAERQAARIDAADAVAVKLLHGFRRWTVEGGAVALYVSVSAGIRMPQAARFLRKPGLRPPGRNYFHEL